MEKKKVKLSQSFLKWLLFLVSIAFITTTVCLWVFQTNMAKENAYQLLLLNIKDVRSDIRDASNESLLSIAYDVKSDIEESGISDYTSEEFSEYLTELTKTYDLAEANYVNKEGIIKATTHPDFQDYDMRNGNQSSEFLVLIDEETEYVQTLRPVSHDESISRKYAGVRLADGGFVQIGYDKERAYESTVQSVVSVTRNRHVGKDGCVIIADPNRNIVYDRSGNEGKNLSVTGIFIDKENLLPSQPFEAVVYGEPSYCMYHETEGYTLVAVIPQREAALSRNLAVTVTTIMQTIVFAALFLLIYYLVHKLVVTNICKINSSLSEITEGNLETVVNVRSHKEFDELSNDINSTVDTLKKYIADAAARIDAELAFAKAIQHSSLPSVFPPYPNRREFEIYASMHTAKEVGGDFYDFYFADDEHLVFLIADVAGKGIPAAMFMMTAKTAIKSLAESGMSAEEVFTQANNRLCEGNDADMFVTAWMGILNTKTGNVRFANAGHNPPLVKHADGSFEFLQGRKDLVLACMDDFLYHSNEVQLEPGDIIYLYTDGVTEASNSEEEYYGEERLKTLLNTLKNESAKTICETVKTDVDAFVGEEAQFDDITMLALKYNGTAKE